MHIGRNVTGLCATVASSSPVKFDLIDDLRHQLGIAVMVPLAGCSR
jgi:hypothetical protein